MRKFLATIRNCYCRLDKKYLMLAFLLALIAIFGYRIDPNYQLDPEVYRSFGDGYRYCVFGESGECNIANAMASAKGDNYRLGMRPTMDREDLPMDISITAVGVAGNTMNLGSRTITSIDNLKPIEIVFTSDNFLTNLEIKTSHVFSGKSYLKNGFDEVFISRLASNDPDSLKSLSETLRGEAAEYWIRPEQDLADHVVLNSNRGPSSTGYLFEADSNLISSIALKIKMHGNGGFGNYKLLLRKAKINGEKIELESDVIRDVRFNEYAISKYWADDKLSLPIMAKVEKGSMYLLVLDCSDVNTNFENYIEFLGVKPSDKPLTIKDGDLDISRADNCLFVQITNAHQPPYSSRLLYGASVEDLGAGFGHYLMRNEKNISDLKNLDSSQNYYYDAGHESLFFKNELIVRADTIYPVREFKVTVRINIDNKSNLKFYISSDNQTWQEAPGRREPDTNQLTYSISGRNETELNIIYLKLVDGSGRYNELQSYGINAALELKK